MKRKCIVLVRTPYWWHDGENDLFNQTEQCLAYARKENLRVMRIFRRSPWKSGNKDPFSSAYEYAKSRSDIEFLVTTHGKNLDKRISGFVHRVSELRKIGLKISFLNVINKTIVEE